MEEYVDVLNEENGNVTGDVITKKEAHKLGVWHRAIHIWIISKDKKKILLQKRCEDKDLFPNMWDISVGGHVSKGEDTLVAATRELKEELGLEGNLEYVDIIKEKFEYKDILSNEFVTIYKIIDDIDLSSITLQKEEVSKVDWFTKEEFNKLIDNKEIINHDEEYDMINNILE